MTRGRMIDRDKSTKTNAQTTTTAGAVSASLLAASSATGSFFFERKFRNAKAVNPNRQTEATTPGSGTAAEKERSSMDRPLFGLLTSLLSVHLSQRNWPGAQEMPVILSLKKVRLAGSLPSS